MAAETAALAREILALEGTVRAARERLDAVPPDDPRAVPADSAVADLAAELAAGRAAVVARSAAALSAELDALAAEALRQYFLRGAQYSARAILADRGGGERFRVASAAVAPLQRLAGSAPDLAARVARLGAAPGAAAPPLPRSARKGELLRDLLAAGATAHTEDGLAAWVALLHEAQAEGAAAKKELDAVLSDVAAINGRSASRASLEASMARFEAMSAAAARAAAGAAAEAPGAGAEEAADAAEAAVRGADDVLRQLDALATGAAADREARAWPRPARG